MFEPEKILSGLLFSGFSGHKHHHRKKEHLTSSFFGGGSHGSGMLGGHTSTAFKMGALGIAIAAFDHFMEQRQGQQPSPASGGTWTPGVTGGPQQPPQQAAGNWFYGPENPGGAPGGSTSATPPPPPPGAPPAAASAGPSASAESHRQDAVILIQAMIAAANADGILDAEERGRILEKLQVLQLSNEERSFITSLLLSPPTLDQVVRQVQTPELAQQVYAASLMAVDVDTEQEKAYFAELAQRLNLDPSTVQTIHGHIGIEGEEQK